MRETNHNPFAGMPNPVRGAPGGHGAKGAHRAVLVDLPKPSGSLLVLLLLMLGATVIEMLVISAMVGNIRHARTFGAVATVAMVVLMVGIGIAIRRRVWLRVNELRDRRRRAAALLRGEIQAGPAESCAILAAGAGCVFGRCEAMQRSAVRGWIETLDLARDGAMPRIWIDSAVRQALRNRSSQAFGMGMYANPDFPTLYPRRSPFTARHGVFAAIGAVGLPICVVVVASIILALFAATLTPKVQDLCMAGVFVMAVVAVPVGWVGVYRFFQRTVRWILVGSRIAVVWGKRSTEPLATGPVIDLDEAVIVVSVYNRLNGTLRENHGTLWMLYLPDRPMPYLAHNLDYRSTPWASAIHAAIN